MPATDTDLNEQAFQDGFDKVTYGFSRRYLEQLGERAVRDRLNLGKYGAPGDKVHAFVLAWISDVTFIRSEEESSRRSDREAATLSISKDSNSIARNALRWAIIAQIIATIAIAITAKDHILNSFSALPNSFSTIVRAMYNE